jgi:phospholipase/lecithinase/hemolysin
MRISVLVNTLRVASISLLIVLLSSCGGSSNNVYSGLVIIGASLSDTGNVSAATSGATPGSPNYFGGRWSNGVLWIEKVAEKYSLATKPSLLGGKNYAYGGAYTCTITGASSGVVNMCDQTTQYLASVSNAANPGDLFVIDASTVGNDMGAVLTNGLSTSLVTTTAPANVISVMQRLYTAGARKFLVVNAPDVGATPRFIGLGLGSTGTALAQGFNATLATSLNTFINTNPLALVYQLDAFTIGSGINANPAAYGLNNVTQPCVTSATSAVCTTPDTYAYWDSFHPTKAVGVIIGNAAYNLIK